MVVRNETNIISSRKHATKITIWQLCSQIFNLKKTRASSHMFKVNKWNNISRCDHECDKAMLLSKTLFMDPSPK